MSPTIVIALLAPCVGAASLFIPGLAHRRRLVVTVSLTLAISAVVVSTDAGTANGPWAMDRLGWLLALASLTIGLCVCHYAARQFDGEGRARGILAASLATVGGVVATDLARTPASLIASWIATSFFTVLLLRASEPARAERSVARFAAVTFVVSDSLLVVGAICAFIPIGSPSMLAGFSVHVHGFGALVLLGAGTLAAVGRSGLTFRHSWVTETINVPTSTSALLHAGVVNAGALLLWRLHEMAGDGVLIDVTLALLCFAVLVALAPKIHARVDLKGQLATSTVSQMAFMLLAMALGVPILAVTHLIGHGIYKASRFMSAGGATQQRARLRRREARGRVLTRSSRATGAFGVVALSLLFGSFIHPDGLAVMGVFGPAAAVVWWSRTSSPVLAGTVTWCVLLATLALYGGVVAGVGWLIAPDVPTSMMALPWWLLGLTTAVVATITTLRHRDPAAKQAPVVTAVNSESPVEDGVAA